MRAESPSGLRHRSHAGTNDQFGLDFIGTKDRLAVRTLDEAVHADEELEETAKLFFILADRKTVQLTTEAIAKSKAVFAS